MMRYRYAYQTDIGNSRDANQDSLIIKHTRKAGREVHLAAVFDGLGGLSRGEENSRRAAELLSRWFETEFLSLTARAAEPEEILEALHGEADRINETLFLMNRAAGSAGGTTMSAILIGETHRYILHVGDSRIYENRDGVWTQLTKDHSFVAREVELGHMTEEEAAHSKKKHVLLQCLGAAPRLAAPQLLSEEIHHTESYLLCTDGFWHRMDLAPVTNALPEAGAHPEVMEQALEQIVEENKQSGEKDNLTVIALFPSEQR